MPVKDGMLVPGVTACCMYSLCVCVCMCASHYSCCSQYYYICAAIDKTYISLGVKWLLTITSSRQVFFQDETFGKALNSHRGFGTEK